MPVDEKIGPDMCDNETTEEQGRPQDEASMLKHLPDPREVQAHGDDEEWYRKWTFRLNVILTAMQGTLLVAAVIVAVIYLGQLKAMRQSNRHLTSSLKDTRDAFEISSRAWVLLDKNEWTERPGQPPVLSAFFRNVGHIPAYRVTITSRSAAAPIDTAVADALEVGWSHPPPPDVPPGVGVLGADQDFRQIVDLSVDEAAREKWSEIGAGTYHWYYFGTIEYADEFSEDRATGFCLVLFTRQGIGQERKLTLGSCDHPHNWAR